MNGEDLPSRAHDRQVVIVGKRGKAAVRRLKLRHHSRTISGNEVSQGRLEFAGKTQLWCGLLKRDNASTVGQRRDKDSSLHRFRAGGQRDDAAIQAFLPGPLARAGTGRETTQVAQAQGQQAPRPQLWRGGGGGGGGGGAKGRHLRAR